MKCNNVSAKIWDANPFNRVRIRSQSNINWYVVPVFMLDTACMAIQEEIRIL